MLRKRNGAQGRRTSIGRFQALKARWETEISRDFIGLSACPFPPIGAGQLDSAIGNRTADRCRGGGSGRVRDSYPPPDRNKSGSATAGPRGRPQPIRAYGGVIT